MISPPLESLSYAAIDHYQEGWPIHADSLDNSLDNKLQPEVHLDGSLELHISPWIAFVVLCATVKQSYDAMQATLDNVIEFLEEQRSTRK